MSVVSSVLSTRSSGWKINDRLSSLMDSIFAIGFGLGLRFVVDAVSHHDFKLTGTLVGLWEGVIMLHFLKKMPKSSDPYVAYGVRLFVDFICTESIARLVLVLIWTALGMVLADVTPAIWDDVGLKRIWNRFRRDLYTISQMIPTVAFFPPTRTVRFSPSREPSVIIEEPSVLQSPSIITAGQTPVSNTVPPTTTATPAREALKRRVPGYFPTEYSDTETDLGSIRAGRSTGRTSRRLSVYPDFNDTDLSSNTSQNDLDEGNLSSGASSASTERAGPSSTVLDTTGIPDMDVEEEVLADTAVAAPVKHEEGETTPRQQQVPYLPPTPSDSAARWRLNRDLEEPLPVRPPSAMLPQIPDFLEEASTEDWEKIQTQEAADYNNEEKPPTPPAKDDLPPHFAMPPARLATSPPQEQQQSRSIPSPDDDWDTLNSQFISPPDAATTTNDHRQSLPPPYKAHEEFDDIYGDFPQEHKAPAPTTHGADDEGAQTGNLIDDSIVPPSTNPFLFGESSGSNPWGGFGQTPSSDEQQLAESKRKEEEEEAARQQEKEEQELRERAEQEERRKEKEKRKAAEEEERKASEEKRREEELRLQKETEEAELKKNQEEEEKQRIFEEQEKKKQEIAERKKKEMEDERARKKKREEEQALAAKKAAEAEAQREKEKEEQIKHEQEAAQRRKEKKEAADRRQKAKEEEERKKQEEAAAAQAAEEERQEQQAKRKEEEAAAERIKAEEAAATLAKAEEEERQREEEKVRKEAEEAEAKRIQEAPNAEREMNSQGQGAPEAVQTAQGAEAASPHEESTQNATPPENLEDARTLTAPVPEEPPQPEQPQVQAVDEESVVSMASEMPGNVRDRVTNLLLLKAQMVEMKQRIEELKEQADASGGDEALQDIQRVEKVLRKMQKKESRRYDETKGITHEFLDDQFDTGDSIALEGAGLRGAETKIEEKLEELLSPETDSIKLTINVAKGQPGKKQKQNVTGVLDRYKLLGYTREKAKVGRVMTVDVPSESFAEWLIAFRSYMTQAANDSDSY